MGVGAGSEGAAATGTAGGGGARAGAARGAGKRCSNTHSDYKFTPPPGLRTHQCVPGLGPGTRVTEAASGLWRRVAASLLQHAHLPRTRRPDDVAIAGAPQRHAAGVFAQELRAGLSRLLGGLGITPGGEGRVQRTEDLIAARPTRELGLHSTRRGSVAETEGLALGAGFVGQLFAARLQRAIPPTRAKKDLYEQQL